MALAIDSSTPAFAAAEDDPWTTASFTPPNNSLLVAVVDADWINSTPTISVTSTGLNFVRAVRGGALNQGVCDIWVAEVGSNGGSSRTVSATTSLTFDSGGIKVYVITGQASGNYINGTNNGTGSTADPLNVTLDTTKNDTWVMGGATEWQSTGAPTSTDVYESWDGADLSLIVARKSTARATPGTETINFNSVGTPLWSWSLIGITSTEPLGVWCRATTTGAPASASAFSPTLPTHATGDRLLLFVTGKVETTTIPTINQSWTLLNSGTGGTGTNGADTGQTFWAVYGKDAASGSETAPTVTPGATAPNSWEWACFSYVSTTGIWADPIETSADWVQSASDTSTSSPLTGTTGAFGTNPTEGDAIVTVGVIPTDLGTALGTTTVTCTGLSGGTKNTATTNYQENALGNDTALVWADWQEFTGTASAGVALSYTVTGATNQSGSLIAVALREGSAGANEGASTGAVGWAGSSTGVKHPAGSASGAVGWAGSATGAHPQYGSATGAIGWAGSAAGVKHSAGAATGAVGWAGSATGAHPQYGSATGAIGWAGSAAGARTSAGSATGAVGWAGSSTGAHPQYGAATGAIEWAGSATGEQPSLAPNEGSATGSIGWAGSATGSEPDRGSVSGAIGWAGSATGARLSSGAASGAIGWAGSATGARTSSGAATGAVGWAGSASGSEPDHGAASGAIDWAGTAEGFNLAAPGNFTVTVISNSEIDLDWDGVTGALGYHVYRDDVLVKSITDATAWADTALDPSTEYCYRVTGWR